MNILAKSTLEINQNTEELQEKTIAQEELHEREVKTMKKEIELLKHQTKDSDKIFRERVQDLQDKYISIISFEKESSQNILSLLQAKLSSAKEEYKTTKDESRKTLEKSNKIRESFHEELENLTSQKASLVNLFDEISKRIKEISGNEVVQLGKKLKKEKTVKNNEFEKAQQNIEKEKEDILLLVSQKTELTDSLQASLAGLKDELALVKDKNHKKISDIKNKINAVRLEKKDVKFKINQLKLGQEKKSTSDKEVIEKTKVLERIHKNNKELWEKYEKLNKLIY